ncbi:MAG: UDP-3-O-(3-hydroxymyristoyl)glucosamine N-acyltransferase [Candidatus Protistobacter heckmanni]|nr:UDP-3-O-(3-hydroxymyristoyl)glucosamine N-acyltransferase [Candidatus Protistobacter heckmanni]
MTGRNTPAEVLVSAAELAARCGGEVVGSPEVSLGGVAPLESAEPDKLAFLSNPKYLSQVHDTGAGAVVLSRADLDKLGADSDGRTWIVSANPYAFFARAAQLFAKAREARPGLAASAHVAPDAVVPDSCEIGPFVSIGAGAVLGERVRLLGHVHIGEGAAVGDDSVIHPHVSLYHGCVIGKRCIVHSGTVIGSDGFGFAPDFGPKGGEWVKIPQTGRAVVGDDVEIGANCSIDRGAMADTVIEPGCKLDNQIQIAHNVRVGAFTVIAGCAAIAGSTTVGKFCMIGGSANLAGHLTVADKTIISGGTSVTKSIAKPGQYTSVFPIMPHGDWEKNAALVRQLGSLRERLRKLENLFKSNSST